MFRRTVTASAAVLLWSSVAAAANDQVTGTFTVKGKTPLLKQVYASSGKKIDDSSQKYFVVLVSDAPIAEADRDPARLLELSKTGAIHALRVIWSEGLDTVAAVPYHSAIPSSGKRAMERPTLEFDRLDDTQLEVRIHSKMIGQDWHYNARMRASIAQAPAVTLEPSAEDVEADPAQTALERAAPGGSTDPRTLKRELGASVTSTTPRCSRTH